MYDIVILICQTVMLAGAAAWMLTGVWDNIMIPVNNEQFTTQVMEMQRMRDSSPAEYARVSHRAIRNRTTQMLAFRLVVLVEALAALVMCVGVVLMALAIFGAVAPETAKSVALIGTCLFTSVWCGFLVVGNYFCYWFAHEAAQNTHYQMTLWGMALMIFLAVA